jgi:hypothetical protein
MSELLRDGIGIHTVELHTSENDRLLYDRDEAISFASTLID